MEYVFVNDWYIYWFASLTLIVYTLVTLLIAVGVSFVATIVYDIYKQVSAKWKTKK